MYPIPYSGVQCGGALGKVDADGGHVDVHGSTRNGCEDGGIQNGRRHGRIICQHRQHNTGLECLGNGFRATRPFLDQFRYRFRAAIPHRHVEACAQ